MVERMSPRKRAKLNRAAVLRALLEECRPIKVSEGLWQGTRVSVVSVDEVVRMGLKRSKVEWALRRLELEGRLKRTNCDELVFEDMLVPSHREFLEPWASGRCPEGSLQTMDEKDAYAEKKPRFSKRLGRRVR